MMKNFLYKKNILFLSWPFYQYPQKIIKMLEMFGATVTYYSSAPTDNFLKIKFFERYEFLKKKYFIEICEEIKKQKYDFVFMINAAVFPEYFLQKLNKLCSNAVKILYSWDSLKVYPKAQERYKYFDKIYSFDSEDVKKNKELNFLPLFYCDDFYENVERLTEYDFCFVGFGHSERYNFIQKIKNFAIENNYKYYFALYLPSILHYIRGKYIRKIFSEARKKDFVYHQLTQNKIKEIINNSQIVIDLELSEQSGLTMRTIEAHGMRKKIITTNKHIKEYDFYNPNNILIVDRNNPIIIKEFIEKKYQPLPIELYKKYSLSNWVQAIFMVENEN